MGGIEPSGGLFCAEAATDPVWQVQQARNNVASTRALKSACKKSADDRMLWNGLRNVEQNEQIGTGRVLLSDLISKRH